MTVYNAGRKSSPDGELNDISGIAVTTDEPGELLVYFEGSTDASDCACFFSFLSSFIYLIGIIDIVINNIHCCIHARFFSFSSTFSFADWVILLGPQAGSDNFYQYSVVSDPYRLFLFVLCRDVDDFRAK